MRARCCRPSTASEIRYHGPVGGGERVRALGSARALLHLIDFEEPFGLSVIEAMACGTPVIATSRGSMPELIDDGVTGFLVDRVEEAVAAIGRIGEIDRAAMPASGRRALHRRQDGRRLSRPLSENRRPRCLGLRGRLLPAAAEREE